MAFTRTVRDVVTPFSASFAVINQQRTNLALTTGVLSVTIPASGNFSPTLTAGYVRVKHTTNSLGSNASVGLVNVVGSDGTNTYQLVGAEGALSGNNVQIDKCWDFRCDFGLVNITISINNQNNNSNFDFEVAGNS